MTTDGTPTRPTAGGPVRAAPVRLTDQALVAVAVARRFAGSARATVAHLLLGLAGEPDGRAGQAFRSHTAATARLAERVASAAPALPALEVAVGWAARDVQHRPLWTQDLLAAALEVGGSDLDDLLAATGLVAGDLAVESPDAIAPWAAFEGPEGLAETHGYDPTDTSWLPPAARAVARARAVGGGAVALVVALVVEQALDPDAVPLPAALERRLCAGHATATRAPVVAYGDLTAGQGGSGLWHPAPDAADRGLDVVVDAARRSRDPDHPVMPLDLLRAALLVGGDRPAALLSPEEEEPQT